MDNKTNPKNPFLASTESNEIFPTNYSTFDQEPSSDMFDPWSSIIPGHENEDYDMYLQQLLMLDLYTNLNSNPPPLHNLNSNQHEIVGGFSENNIMDIGSTSYFNNTFCGGPPLLQFDQLDEQSKNTCMVTQSYQQMNHLAGMATMEPSYEAAAPPNTPVLGVDNGQMMVIPLAFPAAGYPPLTSFCSLDNGFGENKIVHTDPFDEISTCLRRLREYPFTHELQGTSEIGKKRRKPSDGRRRCSCKKSKCLQRYCECFCSGFSCDVACGCEGCHNTDEQTTLVFEKREEIKRKNSLAFSSKIEQVEEGSEPHGIGFARKNKRHKRGCSCSKTKCLEKYCECYQAEAGSGNFVSGEAMNNHVNTHGFHINGGSIRRQAQMGFISVRSPRLSVSEAGSGMRVTPLPPLFISDDVDTRGKGQGYGEKNNRVF